jgi:hypothetical protein
MDRDAFPALGRKSCNCQSLSVTHGHLQHDLVIDAGRISRSFVEKNILNSLVALSKNACHPVEGP